MILADLNFAGAGAPPALNAVNLNFGVDDTGAIDPASFAMVMVKAAPVAVFTLGYASNVSRPVGILPDMAWEKSSSLDKASGGGWAQAETFRTQDAAPWGLGRPLARNVAQGVAQLNKLRAAQAAAWEIARSLRVRGTEDRFGQLTAHKRLQAVPWEVGQPISDTTQTGFVQLLPFPRQRELLWGEGKQLSFRRDARSDNARTWKHSPDILWSEARKVRPGREAPIVQPPVDPYVPSYDLDFLCKCIFPDIHAVMLNFGLHPCPNPNPGIPDRKVYFIVNSLSLTRVQDDEPVHVNSASVGIDRDSWCWSFTATIPYTELEKVEPASGGPVELELEINNLIWRVLVEEYDEKKVFAKTDITIKGRSVTAYLESPYAPVRSYTQTNTILSRQLAEAELTRPGLITGFSLDWQLIDSLGWSMPANSWSYNDLTPVQVIQAIANGAGGYVNSHPSQKSLIVLPDYPAPFWEWDALTPAKTIPESLIKSRSLRWTEKPAYNGVYVSGENTGVTAFVKRTGTAGSFQAPMYVDPMITHISAARNKGISILSAGGKQSMVSLDLPMEPSLGLVTPGTLIAVQPSAGGTWRGLVRSTAISAAWGKGLTVNQALDLERHYGGL